jgi:diguanylate cyclase (GGDEF)-like protein
VSVDNKGVTVPFQIFTHKDVVRYMGGRVVIAVSLTVALSWMMITLQLGTDPGASVRVGYVTVSVIIIGAIVAALLTGGLSYHTALMMQELTLTRAEMQRISCTDQLTGLLNRRGFDDAALLALAKAKEANLPVVALMCDIDGFKLINDQFGHEFGDKVLVKMGDVIRSFAATTNILVARHGGEEFAALLIGVDNGKALQYAERLRQACATEVSHEGVSTHVTVSIGITSPQREADLPTIMRFADKALYAAKHRGRNRVVVVDMLALALAQDDSCLEVTCSS